MGHDQMMFRVPVARHCLCRHPDDIRALAASGMQESPPSAPCGGWHGGEAVAAGAQLVRQRGAETRHQAGRGPWLMSAARRNRPSMPIERARHRSDEGQTMVPGGCAPVHTATRPGPGHVELHARRPQTGPWPIATWTTRQGRVARDRVRRRRTDMAVTFMATADGGATTAKMANLASNSCFPAATLAANVARANTWRWLPVPASMATACPAKDY
jgi:hypothetical protein